MSELQAALRTADEAYLVGMSNKGLYKRAVKDAAGAEGTVCYTDDTAEVTICGETCTIRVPLWESACSCPSRSICRHILTAILFLQANANADEEETEDDEPDATPETEQVPESPPAPESIPEPDPPAPALLPEQQAAAVRECARQNLELLGDILRHGLVRMPENMAEHLEAAAVRSHTRKMASAERMLRDLGITLRSCRERRAIFRTEQFLSKLTRTAAHLTALTGEVLTEELTGTFRRSYEEYPGELHLLPIGAREVMEEEFAGMVFYFLNLDETAERRFLIYSDLRPVFYDSVKPRRTPVQAPWGAGIPMDKLMHSQLTLVGAKLAGAKLSGSKDTWIACRTEANLNCRPLCNLIRQDFREIAVTLSDRYEETDRLCLIHPAKCLASRFDTHAQQLRMTMEDTAGNHADLRVDYRREQKTFIEELERIGRIMLEKTDKPYVWLCSASFEDGELVFSPIEVYHFIQPERPQPYHLPPEYTAQENASAPEITAFLDEITDELCLLLQSGIASVQDGRGKALSAKAVRCGMEGLADLLTAVFTQAERYRHAPDADPAETLQALIRLSRYLHLARTRLERFTALRIMQMPV